MAIANLLVKIGADISELQVNTARATATFEKTANKIDSIGSGIGKSLIAAFSVGTVISWADQTIQAASRIEDLSKKLKVSTDAIQRWDYALSLSGGSIEDVDNALSFMNKTLGSGNSGVVKALNDMGLSLEDIRQMAPEQAFETIITAAGNIKDPMLQAAAQVAIFGRTGNALFAAMAEGFVQTGKGAAVMSKETIARLDAAGDAWTKLGNKVKVLSGELIAAVFAIFDQPPNEKAYSDKVFKPLHLDIQKAIDDLKELNKWLHVLGDANAPKAPGVPTAFKGTRIAPVSLSREEARDIEQNLDGVRKKLDEGAKAAREESDRLKELARSFQGLDVIKKADDAIKAVNINMREGFKVSQMTTDQQAELNKMMADGIDVFKRHGQVAPQAMRDLYTQTVRVPTALDGIAASAGKIGTEFDIIIPKFTDAGNLLHYFEGIPFGASVGKQFDVVVPKIQTTHDHLDDLSRAFSQLAQVAGGAFGGIAQAIGTLIGSMDAAKKSFAAVKDGFADWKAGSTWEGILGITSGIGGMIAAAITAGKALFDLFDRNKGRDLVVDFAKTMGGFDALHAKLLELGDEGEELWIKLTQGVGRNNPQQAQAAIDAVTAALNRQNKETDKAQTATEEQAQATIETALQASLALDELGAKIDSNADQWGTWSGRVTGYLDDVARSIRALPSIGVPGGGEVPEVPGFAGGTHGRFLNFGSGTLAVLHGREALVTERESLSLGGGDTHIYIGNEAVDSHLVRVARQDAARGGLRTRAASGRSY